MTTITCPRGKGETDRSRCVDRAATSVICLRCAIPVVLIAADAPPDADPVVLRLAARLPELIPGNTPAGIHQIAAEPSIDPSDQLPARFRAHGKSFNGTISRARAVARALHAAFAEPLPRKTGRVGLLLLMRCYREVANAPRLNDTNHLRRALRQCGLPISRSGNAFVIEDSPHVRAFIRSYVREAA